jgi:hypothetical protein
MKEKRELLEGEGKMGSTDNLVIEGMNMIKLHFIQVCKYHN